MTRKFTIHIGKVIDRPYLPCNMDGVGTFEVAKVLQEHKMMTVITKAQH